MHAFGELFGQGLLEELGQTAPRTHNLDDLLSLLRATYPTLQSFRRGLIFLTHYAVETRYPGDSASKRQAASALRWMDRVRTAARALLGIRPPRKGRKQSP